MRLQTSFNPTVTVSTVFWSVSSCSAKMSPWQEDSKCLAAEYHAVIQETQDPGDDVLRSSMASDETVSNTSTRNPIMKGPQHFSLAFSRYIRGRSTTEEVQSTPLGWSETFAMARVPLTDRHRLRCVLRADIICSYTC